MTTKYVTAFYHIITALLTLFQLCYASYSVPKQYNNILKSDIESGGFFTDISDRDWNLKLHIHCDESQKKLQEGNTTKKEVYNVNDFKSYHYWMRFWQANYEPT